MRRRPDGGAQSRREWDMPDPAWRSARSLLAIRLDNLGDVLMTTPALAALKAAVPNRRVTLLASSIGAEAAAYVPSLDGVIRYDAPWMKSTPRPGASFDGAMIEHLAAGRFDGAIVFTVCTQSALPAATLAYLAGIPLRLARCRENPYRLLTHWLPENEASGFALHEVERQLALVAEAGAPPVERRLQFAVPDDARADVEQRLDALGIDVDGPWLVLHPGASAPSRRYAPEKFARAAQLLAARRGARIVITGDAGERGLCDAIARVVPGAVSLAGRLDLPALAALIERAPLLVVNNTGPAHLAAAVGTPVVALYALTNPQHTPWAVPHRVLSHDVPCRNCLKSVCPEGHHDCLERVAPETVAAAAESFLRRGSRRLERVRVVAAPAASVA
jgi:lipopolysaccharide heptosyltransferase II